MKMSRLEIVLQIGKYVIAFFVIGLLVYGYLQIYEVLKTIALELKHIMEYQ
jgi:cell division protein FtsL